MKDLMLDTFEVSKALVIGPLRVCRDTWPAEVEKWDHLKDLDVSVMVGSQKERVAALNHPAMVYIINRENVKWLVEYFEKNGMRFDFDMVIIDELSSFKNYKSERFRWLRKVRPFVKRWIGLTGTPASNGLMDLWSEVGILDGGERLGRFIGRYREAYFRPGSMNPQTGVVFQYIPKPGAEEQIYQRISDITVSMKALDYLQMIFPMMGVRLIAINDNFDTLNDWRNGDSLTVPMKNLINDIYCKDISTKVSTQLTAMMKRGECISAFAPYGYKKDPKNHSKLVVDDDAAANVKQIFVWKLEGYSDRAIADRLNEQGVLSPYEYQNSVGNHVSGGFKRYGKAAWSSGNVYKILHNECYMGVMVQGKWKRLDYRSKESVLLPREKWTRVEGMHEAIVDPELFSLVQEIMEKETRIAGGGTCVELLSGFLFCGECGRQLTMQPSYYKGKKYRYYTCKDCRDEGRKTKRVAESKAYTAILEAIRKMAAIAVRVEALVDEADSLPEQGRAVTRLDGQMVQLQQEMERYARLKSGLYEDYSSGILSREEFMDYSQMYGVRIDKAKATLREVAEERRQLVANYREAKWIESFKKYRNLISLERPILAELVEQVLVYPDGRIEVEFKDTNSIEGTLEAYGYDASGYKDAAGYEERKEADGSGQTEEAV